MIELYKPPPAIHIDTLAGMVPDSQRLWNGLRNYYWGNLHNGSYVILPFWPIDDENTSEEDRHMLEVIYQKVKDTPAYEDDEYEKEREDFVRLWVEW